MTERHVPSRQQWLPSALPVFFGPEPEVTDPWPGLKDVVSKVAELTAAIRTEALQDLVGLEGFDPDILQTKKESSAGRDASDVSDAMRVVLMGRTMAGKSSLLSALTGEHRDRVGDGRQRFSRDVFGAPIKAAQNIVVVDTPGVGARDGAEDFEKAFTAALDADLVLWVASSDSIQEETARALRLLGVIGKPIVVALNCRQSLEGIGKSKLLRFPEQVFGNRDGLVGEIKRHMAASAVEPLDVVYVHALAAALPGGASDAELHAASRVDDLVEVLLREYKAHSDSRRVLRLVDSGRLPADETTLLLATGAGTLAANAEHHRAMTTDIHARLARVVRSAQEAMLADVNTAVGRRRDWHLTVTDFGDTLPSAWEAEVSRLQEELETAIQRHLSLLATTVDDTITDTDAEWSTVSPEQFALGRLHGFNEVWGNRLLRAGIGLGGGLAAAWGGAQIGLAIGAAGGPLAPFAVPIGVVLGGLIGFGASFGLAPLKNLVDRIFLGKDGVLRKRRDEVAALVGPILDEFARKYSEDITAPLDKLHESLSEERAKSDEHSSALDDAATRWRRHSESLQSLIRELDRETATVLLRTAGRERLARSVRRATRMPGVCILTEFEPTAFWEAWLFPPDLGEKLVAGKPAPAGGEAAGSLSYGLGLLERPVSLGRADPSSATLIVHEDVPADIAHAWGDGLTQHIGKHISIETSGKASNT